MRGLFSRGLNGMFDFHIYLNIVMSGLGLYIVALYD